MKPYGIISDSHHHNWSAFATVGTLTGVNTRLDMLLSETERAAAEVKKAGGDTLYHTGDLFHVRGSIAPSVLNPTLDCYKRILSMGVKIVILAGNHDLEGADSTRVGSAITSLEGVGCKVINTPRAGLHMAGDRIIMIPWIKSVGELKKAIEDAVASDPKGVADVDLMIHAPIDGVIPGLPDHGLDAAWLASKGFRRVFSGHYHHHKDFGNGVYSVGALAHHTWSDVGSKAGFLIVSDTDVRWFKSRAPEFVEITGATDAHDIPLIVDGNYARAKINSTKEKDVQDMRAFLEGAGALGVVILAQKDLGAAPRDNSAAAVKKGESLEASVAGFVKASAMRAPDDLTKLCLDILGEARMTETA